MRFNIKCIFSIACVIFFTSCYSNRIISNKKLYSFADVQTVLDEQIKQWNLGSVDGFMKGYWNSDSMLFITAKGPRYGFQAVSDSYKKNYPSKEAMGNLRFEVIKIQWIDESAGISQVLGKWHVGENSKPQSGYFSLIFKLIDNNPRIVVDHTW